MKHHNVGRGTPPLGWPKPARGHVRLFVMSHDREPGSFRTSLDYEALYETACVLFRAGEIGHWTLGYADMPRYQALHIPRGLLKRGRNVR